MPMLENRVRETTDTVGVGDYTLRGAPPGFQTFVDAHGVLTTQQTFYCCEDGVDWEIGVGTITAGPVPTLTRDTILASSNGGAAVNWGPGTRDLFETLPASRLVHKDSVGLVGSIASALRFAASNGNFAVLEQGYPLSRIWHDARVVATLVAAKGEYAWPDGFKIKWGKEAVGADSSLPVAFITSFATPFLAIVAYESAKDSTTPAGRLSYTLTADSIALHNGDTAAATVVYLAVGI